MSLDVHISSAASVDVHIWNLQCHIYLFLGTKQRYFPVYISRNKSQCSTEHQPRQRALRKSGWGLKQMRCPGAHVLKLSQRRNPVWLNICGSYYQHFEVGVCCVAWILFEWMRPFLPSRNIAGWRKPKDSENNNASWKLFARVPTSRRLFGGIDRLGNGGIEWSY